MDKKYMARALELAALGEGAVNPNPLVGAVVVKNNKVIGEGYHKKYGGPHAEVFALEMAGEEARGADIYVTLEPCSHYGKTPPCAKKIIEMGIKRCIVASLDPNPLVSGRGIKMLQEAGIEVITGVMDKEAKELNRVFMKYISEKTSYLFLKCGITLDGKIATKTGNSKWITNELAREKVQKLRNKYMGIMVGINTVIKDDPSLTARIENGRDPYRIVIDPNLDIPLESKFVNFQDGKSIVITSESNREKEKVSELEERKVKLVYLEGTDFKISDILKKTGELGIDGILLEGGSYLISKAFEEKAIDGGEIFIAPKILGDEKAISFVKGFSVENIADDAVCQRLFPVVFNRVPKIRKNKGVLLSGVVAADKRQAAHEGRQQHERQLPEKRKAGADARHERLKQEAQRKTDRRDH